MRAHALHGATLGALLGYAAATLAPFLPTLYFLPRLGLWRFAALAGEPAISWYGVILVAALGGAVGAAACTALRIAPSWRWLCGLATLLWIALAWHERHWFMR